MRIVDNFLPSKVFLELRRYCEETEFKSVYIADKPVFILKPPQIVLPYLKIEGHSVILAFIRCDCQEHLEPLNIHADGLINGNKTSIAVKIYINKESGVTPNATCFYTHNSHGIKLPDDVSWKEYTRLLKKDSSDEQKWLKTDCVANKSNRRLVYDSNLFTSREPSQISSGRRTILEVYYKKTTP
jgi:hypothetical protein